MVVLVSSGGRISSLFAVLYTPGYDPSLRSVCVYVGVCAHVSRGASQSSLALLSTGKPQLLDPSLTLTNRFK